MSVLIEPLWKLHKVRFMFLNEHYLHAENYKICDKLFTTYNVKILILTNISGQTIGNR